MWPLVMAPATKYVPASILSKSTFHSKLPSESTPVISIVDSPAPLIEAPDLLRKFASSTTSGSFAQFFSVVFPLVKTAAIIRFSVPVTDIFGNSNSIGLSLSAFR